MTVEEKLKMAKQTVGRIESVSGTDSEHFGLDEVIAFGAYFHIERMSPESFWMAVEAGGKRVVINLRSNGILRASVEEE